MKGVIRNTAVLITIFALLLSGACGREREEQAEDKSLYEHGLELVSVLEEMANSDQYIELYGGTPQLKELLSAAGSGDFTSPSAVYRITGGRSMGLALGMLEISELSEELQKSLKSRMLSAIITQINALGGSTVLAASSVCTAQKLFVSGELTENEIYLYVYENAVPVAVTFVAGEGGAVSATGMFILYDGFHADTVQAAADFLQGLGAEVEEVVIK